MVIFIKRNKEMINIGIRRKVKDEVIWVEDIVVRYMSFGRILIWVFFEVGIYCIGCMRIEI